MIERHQCTEEREANFISYDERVDLQNIVDKQDGVYLGHPSTATLKDGKTIFMVYPKGHGFGQIVLKKSEDGGKTWSKRLDVPESFSTSLECPTIFRMEDAAGKSRLMIFSGRYPFRMSVSEDSGAHFSELKSIGNFGGFFISSMVSMGKGRYMAFFHDEGAFIHGGKEKKLVVHRTGYGDDVRTTLFSYKSDDGGKTYSDKENTYWKNITDHEGNIWEPIYESYCGNVFADRHFELYSIVTEDGGLTWSEPKMICTHKTAKLCEPCAIKSPDGREIAVFSRDHSRSGNSLVIVSRDGGETWSEPREVCASLTGDRHMATYLEDGRLLISLRDHKKHSDLENNWVAWVGSYEQAISGTPGDCRIFLKRHHFTDTESVPWDCAYPCVEKLEDGTVFLATYGRWEKNQAHYIMSIRLSKDELEKIPRKE